MISLLPHEKIRSHLTIKIFADITFQTVYDNFFKVGFDYILKACTHTNWKYRALNINEVKTNTGPFQAVLPVGGGQRAVNF